MWQPRRQPATREQIFLAAVGVFLVAYVVTLARTRSIEWVLLVSTGALAITIIAGLLITEVIVPPPEPTRSEPDRTRGQAVDFTLPDEHATGSDDAPAAD